MTTVKLINLPMTPSNLGVPLISVPLIIITPPIQVVICTASSLEAVLFMRREVEVSSLRFSDGSFVLVSRAIVVEWVFIDNVYFEQ